MRETGGWGCTLLYREAKKKRVLAKETSNKKEAGVTKKISRCSFVCFVFVYVGRMKPVVSAVWDVR